MRYNIFGNQAHNKELYSKLENIGFTYDKDNPELIISVGGDGTMLSAVRSNLHRIDDVMFVGINTGRLGFYVDFLPSEIDFLIKLLDEKAYNIFDFNLLSYSLISNESKYTSYALNELAITNPIHTQIIDVYINDLHFETFRGTGFLISTPSGSTAYNKSLGGSVIHPSVKSYQLTEIASINNRIYKTISSPLVLGVDHKVSLKSHNYDNIFLIADGIEEVCQNIHTIEANISNKAVKLLTKSKDDFWLRVKRAFID